jgi:hypothetical protein
MARAGLGWIAPAAVALAACAQIINADFDDLKRRGTATATGAAGTGEGGGGSGMGGESGAGGDMPDADTTAMGGASGNGMGGGGTGGGGMGGSRDSGPDSIADASDARPDVEPDRSVTDGPREADALPDIGVSDGEGGILTGAVLNEVNGQGALEDFIEVTNNDATPYDLSQHSIAQGAGMFGLPDTASALAFADGTMLGPKEHLLIVANQAPPNVKGGPNTPCNVPGFAGPPYNVTSCYYVDWGISKSGERIYLLGPNNAIRDYVDFPIPGPTQPPSGKSYGRFPDGTGPFQATSWTPQAENHL